MACTATSTLAPIPGFTEIFCSSDDSLELLPYHQDPLFTEVTAVGYTNVSWRPPLYMCHQVSEADLSNPDYINHTPSYSLKPTLAHAGPDGTTQMLPLPSTLPSCEGLSTAASLESSENLSECGRKRFVITFAFRAK